MNDTERIIAGLLEIRQLLVAMEAASVGKTPIFSYIETINDTVKILRKQK